MLELKRRSTGGGDGFTLIELLVVIAIISVLMAIMLPVLGQVRVQGRRLACKSNVRQICMAWGMYLSSNDERFYQGNRANHDFGGWQGTGGYGLTRVLNSYLGLSPEVESEGQANVFKCPGDGGRVFSRPPQQMAFDYFGNSYQTNILLIGPDKLPVPGHLSDVQKTLHTEINKQLKGLKRSAVSEPGRLVLVGDNNWVTQWYDWQPEGVSWHGRERCFNMGFLDGSVASLEIEKGVYVSSKHGYRVLPFAELDHLAPGPVD